MRTSFQLTSNESNDAQSSEVGAKRDGDTKLFSGDKPSNDMGEFDNKPPMEQHKVARDVVTILLLKHCKEHEAMKF